MMQTKATKTTAHHNDNRDELRQSLRAAGFAVAIDTTAHNLYVDGLRVLVYPTDGGRVDIHLTDDNGCLMWSVNFDGEVPDAVIKATVDAVGVQVVL